MDNESPDQKDGQLIMSWITSLAVSIVFCAFCFLAFSTYVLTDLKSSIVDLRSRLGVSELRIEGLKNEVADLHRVLMVPPPPFGAQQPPAEPPVAQPPSSPQTAVDPAPTNVTVIRGQLPANATINMQPARDAAFDASPVGAPEPQKQGMPNIAVPNMAPAVIDAPKTEEPKKIDQPSLSLKP